MGRGQNININGIWKKLIQTLMNDFEGFKTSVDEVTEDMVETARELELEVEPEDVMNYCNLIIKLFIGEELLLKDEQRKWFLGMETTPGEDALKIVEMTRKDLELYVNLVDKAVAEFENTDYWLQFWKKFYCR